MASESLRPYWREGLRAHFVSNVDGTQMAFMERRDDGYHEIPGYGLPLMYSVKATKA